MPRKSNKKTTEPAVTQDSTVVSGTAAVTAADAAIVVDVATNVVAAGAAVVANAADAADVDLDDNRSCADAMSELIEDLEKLAKVTRGIANKMKKAKKAHDREMKGAMKVSKGAKKTKRPRDPDAPKRAPSGFNKAAPLSKDLCKFLGVDAKTEMSRPAVTKQITKYIKDNNLQNDKNKREIVPDKKLSKLLSGPTDSNEPLTFFNLQKYIKHHFPRASKVAAAPATTASAPVTTAA